MKSCETNGKIELEDGIETWVPENQSLAEWSIRKKDGFHGGPYSRLK